MRRRKGLCTDRLGNRNWIDIVDGNGYNLLLIGSFLASFRFLTSFPRGSFLASFFQRQQAQHFSESSPVSSTHVPSWMAFHLASAICGCLSYLSRP